MRSIEIRQLRYYMAVAQAGSFRKAAEELNISQPPLSVQVRQLEDALGLRLLDREANGVRLTAPGQVFLEHAREILHRLARAVDETRRVSESGNHVLRLGCVTSAQVGLLGSVLSRLRGAMPDLEVEVSDLSSQAQLLALAQGALDVGIIQLPADGRGVSVAPLLADPFALIYTDAFISLDGIADEDLVATISSLPFVGFSPDGASHLHAAQLACCRAAGFLPLTRHVARNAYGVIRYVESGLGVSLIPGTYRNHLAPGTRCRPLPHSQGQLVLGLAWLPERMTPALRRTLAHLLSDDRSETAGFFGA